MALSGQITVTTAGTEVRGTNEPGEAFIFKAMPANTGVIYIGNDGADAVTALNGYPLSAGDSPLVLEIKNLNQVWVDASVSGEKVAWIKLTG